MFYLLSRDHSVKRVEVVRHQTWPQLLYQSRNFAFPTSFISVIRLSTSTSPIKRPNNARRTDQVFKVNFDPLSAGRAECQISSFRIIHFTVAEIVNIIFIARCAPVLQGPCAPGSKQLDFRVKFDSNGKMIYTKTSKFHPLPR